MKITSGLPRAVVGEHGIVPDCHVAVNLARYDHRHPAFPRPADRLDVASMHVG
jgi:hypothetical protein